MSSEFIEGSKHAEMTAAVESHFGTASHRTMPGVASGKGYPMGGDRSVESAAHQIHCRIMAAITIPRIQRSATRLQLNHSPAMLTVCLAMPKSCGKSFNCLGYRSMAAPVGNQNAANSQGLGCGNQ